VVVERAWVRLLHLLLDGLTGFVVYLRQPETILVVCGEEVIGIWVKGIVTREHTTHLITEIVSLRI